jgi:hypothetical protein
MVRPRTQRERIEWTEGHRAVLLHGRAHLRDAARGFFRGGRLDLAAVESAWQELRGELLAAWIPEHPGRRPWGWWRFDAPEPMRRLLGGYDALGDRNLPAKTWHLLTAEIADGFGWYSSVGACEFSDPPIVESEPAFLERHGLLTAAELVALGPDFPREAAMCEQEID